jgi:hypothetical protein
VHSGAGSVFVAQVPASHLSIEIAEAEPAPKAATSSATTATTAATATEFRAVLLILASPYPASSNRKTTT